MTRCTSLYDRRVRVGGGGVHWVHVHPPPPGEKVPLRSEMSKRGEKVPPRYLTKNNVHVPLRYDKIKTKTVGKKNKKRVKGKG